MEKSLEQRIEEAIREEISIIPYNPEWPNLYETEAAILRYRLPESIVIRIEHFGSTAVLGLSAKPIIDVLVQVSSLEKTREEIGYTEGKADYVTAITDRAKRYYGAA